MKMKLTEITLKWPQNGAETKETHIRVEVSRFCTIFFPVFELFTYVYDRYIPIQILQFSLFVLFVFYSFRRIFILKCNVLFNGYLLNLILLYFRQ